MHLVEIDAHWFHSGADQYETQAFPTMKLFIDGAVMEHDNDLGRSWQSIVQWVTRHIDRDHVLKSADEAGRCPNDNELTVIGLFPDEEAPTRFSKSTRHFLNALFSEARGLGIAKEVAEQVTARSSLTCETVKVDKGGAGDKTVDLPREHTHCSDRPGNPRRPEWTDKFQPSVEGKQVKVKRLDRDGGYDQTLRLKCCANELQEEEQVLHRHTVSRHVHAA